VDLGVGTMFEDDLVVDDDSWGDLQAFLDRSQILFAKSLGKLSHMVSSVSFLPA